MQEIPVLDLVLVIVVALSALVGVLRGLVREVLSLGAWIAAILGTLFFGPLVAGWMNLEWGPNLIIGHAAVFVVVLILGAVVRNLMVRLVDASGLTSADRSLGLAFGACRGLLICLVAIIASRPFFEDADWWRASKVLPEMQGLEDLVRDLVGGNDQDPEQTQNGKLI